MRQSEDRNIAMILASESPRRRELLAGLGLEFSIEPADVDESPQDDETPLALAWRLAGAKAHAIAERHPTDLIIAADTLVILEGALLAKPGDADEARTMLNALRGRQHRVMTGVALCIASQSRSLVDVATTPVTMREYTDTEIEAYVASGDPMDKAGAYAIQHPEFQPVSRLGDCYANVVGLPLCHIYRALRQWDRTPPVHPLDGCPWPQQMGYCEWAAPILEQAPPAFDTDKEQSA